MRKGVHGATVERLELAAQVRALRDEGLIYQAIADRLGISRSYASTLGDDPDGSKARARKDSYAGKCVDCGGPTCGNAGPDNAPERCEDCTRDLQHETRFWTRDQIIACFQRFHAETGRSPAASDTLGATPSQRDHFSDSRLAEIESAPALPHPFFVQREFGGWRQAVLAAGLTPAASGWPGHRSERRLSRAAQETLGLIGEGGDTAARIAATRDVTRHSQRKVLTGLSQRGLVAESNDGIYRLVAPLTLDSKEKNMAREFIVLAKNGTGYTPLETVEAVNPAHAIEKVATTEGTFVAVPTTYFKEETVAPVTRFAVVAKDPVAA